MALYPLLILIERVAVMRKVSLTSGWRESVPSACYFFARNLNSPGTVLLSLLAILVVYGGVVTAKTAPTGGSDAQKFGRVPVRRIGR